MYTLYTDDFSITEDSVLFNSTSAVNSTKCFTFTTVNDVIIEKDEQFMFQPVANNTLDQFDKEDTYFTLIIYDDDGKKMICVAKSSCKNVFFV